MSYRTAVTFGRNVAYLVQALADAGIKPSSSKTYTLSEIHDALAAIHDDFAPYVGCDGDYLNEAWYFYYVRGNLITGQYEPSEKRKFVFPDLSLWCN
jgi:ribonuclease T2